MAIVDENWGSHLVVPNPLQPSYTGRPGYATSVLSALGDAARVAPVVKLSVAFVAIFAIAFLGERLSAAKWLGIIVIAGGTYLVAFR